MAPTFLSLFLFTLAARALAQDTSTASSNGTVHRVDVGDGRLTYSPDSITAAVGDKIEFHFSEGASVHDVVQGSFDNPCQPSSDSAFWSGIVTDPATPFTVTVNSTDPIFFYCAVTGHCQAGMVGVINPGNDQSLEDYASAAANADGSSAPTQVQGGVFPGTEQSPSDSSSTTSTATGTATASTATGSASTSTLPGSAMSTAPAIGFGAAAGVFVVIAAIV